MTTQESFKKRIRARMVDTGEKHTVARTALVARANGEREWVSQPEMSNERIHAATGKTWNEWVDLIEEWPRSSEGHSAVAAHLIDGLGLDGWWGQGVTVGWERITGRRLVNQHSDGSFMTSKTKTMSVDAEQVRQTLLDPESYDDLFPGLDAELRSKPTTKVLRIAFGASHALFTLTPLDDGRLRLNVTHERLSAADDVDRWKSYWADWLAALADD